jgi:integral membrane protein (TIGR00529 family)
MDNSVLWLGFIIALIVVISVAKKSLWLSLTLGAFILGFSSLSFRKVFITFLETLMDPAIILLAVSVGIIPLIGGVMEETHLMESLVQNLRIGKKGTLMAGPALFGMLPIPGGALLSAPLVESAGKDINNTLKVQINVWFRHLLIFIYPLATLLPTTKIANIDLYGQIVYMIPFFIFSSILGCFFFIRKINGVIKYNKIFRLKELLIPLSIILLAPLFHFFFLRFFSISEVPLLIGVSLSLIFALRVSRLQVKSIVLVAQKMRVWVFPLIILSMFLFLNMFKASRMSSLIAEIDMPETLLLVGIGAILGFVTGRIQIPVSVIVPIYFSKYSVSSVPELAFAVMFFSAYMGYILSPVHPCVAVSLEYFKVSFSQYSKGIIIPVLLSLIFAAIISLILL